MSSSILTNASAMTALQVLRKTGQDLSTTQNRISTGLKVGSAKENASFWAVAQVMRSDVGAFKAIGDNLSLAQASTSVARDGAEKISDLIAKIKEKVTAAQEGSLDKNKLQLDVDAMLDQIGEITRSANFNGVNLLEESQTVKLLSSLGRSGDSVSASYISFDAQDLSFGPHGGLHAIQDLTVLSRGDGLVTNATDGVTVTQVGDWAMGVTKGDKLTINYNDEGGVARTFTYTVKADHAGTDTGANDLVTEMMADASFSKKFAVSYDTANSRFEISAANRDVDYQVTGWSGSAFATQYQRVSDFGAYTVGSTAATDVDLVFEFTDTAGNAKSIAVNDIDLSGAAGVAADEATLIQTALRTALDTAGYNSDLVTVAHDGANLDITSSIGDFTRISIAATSANLGAFQVNTANTAGEFVTATPANVANSNARISTQQLNFQDSPLRLNEQIGLNFTVNNQTYEIVFKVAGNDTDTGARLDDGTDSNRIVLALDSRKVTDEATTGATIVAEIQAALAATTAPGRSATDLQFGTGADVISTGGASAGVDVGIAFSSNNITLSTAASATDSLSESTLPATDYQALLDNIEEAYTSAINAASTLGSAQARLDIQKEFVTSMVDNLKIGIGTLVDADMTEESARLQALQVQQQLGTQSLSIANQAPQMLLSLFRGG